MARPGGRLDITTPQKMVGTLSFSGQIILPLAIAVNAVVGLSSSRYNDFMKRKQFFVAVIFGLSLIGGFWPAATAAAANFTYNTTVTYKVESDDTTSVTEVYDVTNNTARTYLSEIKLLTPTDTVDQLKVTYSDGSNIAATTAKKSSSRGDIKYDYQEISIAFPRQIVGNGREWKFSVNYRATGLVESKGSSHTVYVPSIDPGDPGDSYSATVDVAADYGTPHFAGAPSTTGGISGTRQLYNFTKSDLVQHSLALAFGDATIYHANFNFPLRNDSPWPQTETVALPPDLNNQKVFIDSLNPKPASLHLDEDGNVLADYHLNAHQALTVTTDVSTEVKYLEYDLSASGKKSDIPADLAHKYTKATQYWQTGGNVGSEAAKLVDNNAPVLNNVKAIYQYVINKLSYNDDKIKFNIRQGSTNALAHPDNAVCLEYADLMIAMLRSQGIPARMPIGYAYSGSLKASPTVADSLHAWVEAYIPGVGWMTFDPTWGEKFDEFGKSDLDHFAFAVWGNNDSAPDAVTAGSTDLNYQYEATKVDFRSKVTAVSSGGSLSVQRFVIFPGLAYDRVVATAQPQVSTDNNQVEDGVVLGLGSLAPNQTVKTHRLVLGGNWNKSAQAKFERVDGNQTLVLATTTVHPNYLPMLGLILLLIVGAVLGVIRLRSRRSNSQASPKEPAKTPEAPTNPPTTIKVNE